MSSGLLGGDDENDGGKVFGERYNGRYHLPLLPFEQGTKAGSDYVPYGVMSATNLAGAFVDSRELSLWEQLRMLIGLAEREEIYERVRLLIDGARVAGTPLADLDATPEGKALRAELLTVASEARSAGGASIGADKGTNRHKAWEVRGKSGLLVGTASIRVGIEDVEKLLEQHQLERVSGLQERVVRNTALTAAGRFDDILLSRKTGRLYLADLKTKAKPFYSWVETWIQQAVYATAEWMLDDSKTGYVDGPAHHVGQDQSILLRMPSNGAPAFLQRVDLRIGYRWAALARAVVDARSEGRAVDTHALTAWSE